MVTDSHLRFIRSFDYAPKRKKANLAAGIRSGSRGIVRWSGASMIGRLSCGLALLLGCCAGASAAAAKDCGPLKMVASAKLVSQRGYLQTIPVTINGSPKQFLLDTGGVFTQIAPDVARDLGLTHQSGATPIFNASGDASQGFVKLDTFELGGMSAKDVYLRVSPSNLGADGLLSPDVLKRYDVEMDFAGGKLNYFLPDHCYGKVVYWPHTGVAQLSIVLADKRWIKVPVELDGQSFMAVIDTGATSTVISTQKAQEAFGLTPGSPGMEPAGNVNGDPNLASHAHTFSSLTLDGIAIKNLRVLVIPDRVTEADSPKYRYYMEGGKLYSQKRLEMPELILGMDVLKHLRLYFAFEEHKLYATPAEVPAIPVSEMPAKPAADTAAKSGNDTLAKKLSPLVTAAIREAQDALRKKDYSAALDAVSKARAVPGPQPLDVFIIHRVATSIHVGLKDLAAAVVDAEAAADTDPGVIPESDKALAYKAALQLSLDARHYDKAARYAKFYQATNPPASDQALISAALSHAGDNAGAGSNTAASR
jgi:predicted aspartyl protease